MKYGIPSLLEFRTVEEHMRFCAENGFDFFEMNLSFPWFQSDKTDVDNLIRLRKKYGVDYTVHLHDQINPFDFSPEIREGSLKAADYALELSGRIGAGRITMHLQNGMYSSVSGTKIYAYEVCSDEYLSYVEKAAGKWASKLRGKDTFFCIENTSGFRSYHKKAIELMLEHKEFGLTFDVGHNFKASEDDQTFILSHKDRIRHFHIHDVNAKSNHVTLGTGVLDIPSYLELVKDLDCPAVIEVKETAALLQSMQFIYDMERR